MVAVNDILRGASFFAGADGDGHAVLVTASDKEDFFPFESEIPYIYVSGYINSCQMTDVNGAVGVGKCSRDGRTLEILFHICDLYSKLTRKVTQIVVKIQSNNPFKEVTACFE